MLVGEDSRLVQLEQSHGRSRVLHRTVAAGLDRA